MWDIHKALDLVPLGIRLVIVEGIAALVPDGRISDYKVVRDFISSVKTHAAKREFAILGTVHTTKTKEGERYENPRQRILGSTGWGAFGGNIILIEPEKPSKIDDVGRILIEAPRNGRPREHKMQLDDHGLLQPATAGNEMAPKLMLLHALPVDTAFTRKEVIWAASALQLGVGDSTIDRWLQMYNREGHIKKIEGGYVRASLSIEKQWAGQVLPDRVRPDSTYVPKSERE